MINGIAHETFSKKLKRWLRICTVVHNEGRDKMAAELEGLQTARKELDHEKTKMHLTLNAMAEQLRATYGG